MQLFQILGSAALLTVAAYYIYNAIRNSYLVTITDTRGVEHRRDTRNGRFVKVK